MRHNGKSLEYITLPRMVEIDRLLATKRGVTVEELTERLGVASKTIRRDLHICQTLYGRKLIIDVDERHGRKRYRIDPSNRMFAVWVSRKTKELK